MRFPPSLLDEIRARVPVSQVVARKVDLKRAGRELRGLSPFKQEKTPSFFVNDQKGSWFDFSSGQNGDIFAFVMMTEGLSFPEAVTRLAEEAGVALPKPGAQAEKLADEREGLYGVLEASARYFEAALAGPGGSEARSYLERRGLGKEAIARFRLGFAPDSRSALKEHLARAGVPPAQMIASGMLVAGPDIALPFDRFRRRIMFPIADLSGRVIAFGGRALDPAAPAKYLNSPETPLFHKGGVLYNAHPARQAARDKGQIIAVEGYMDAIALSQAGFAHTVAPLGTALTEAQLRLLWRMAPEPILCFDGDAAGRRAGFRAVEVVLPHLTPGFSVRFAFLPDGLDPDDLVREHGGAALAAVLDKASPLFDVLIAREEHGGSLITPDARAALQARLTALVARIGDRGVREEYQRELREVLWNRTGKLVREIARGDGRRAPHIAGMRRNNAEVDWRVQARAGERARLGGPPRAALRDPAPVRSNALAQRSLQLPAREALILVAVLNHPWLLEAHCEQLAALTLTSPPLLRLRAGMLQVLAEAGTLDRAGLRSHLSRLGLDKPMALAERAITHASDRFAAPDAEAGEVEAGWRHAVKLHETQVGLRRSLETAQLSLRADPSDAELAHIVELARTMAEGEVESGDGG
jgi:DNA primase